MLILYFDFENKHDPIVKPIELYFLPNNQYIGPYNFTLVLLNFKCPNISKRLLYLFKSFIMNHKI
jgi:hypothetical protein